MKRLIFALCVLLLSTGCGQRGGQPSESNKTTVQSASSSASDPIPPSVPAPAPAPAPLPPLTGKRLCIDAGHGITQLRTEETLSPHSADKKPAHVSGTAGRNQTEEALNLAVSLKLQALLEAQGAAVIMTRTTHESDLSNQDRARLANENQVDLCIRIHADSASQKAVHGMSMLVPAGDLLAAQAITAPSRTAGETILAAAVSATGAKNNGIIERTDLTGFNFAEVPTVLLEMGFMSNPEEDAKLETAAYQDQVAQGICDGIVQYLSGTQK